MNIFDSVEDAEDFISALRSGDRNAMKIIQDRVDSKIKKENDNLVSQFKKCLDDCTMQSDKSNPEKMLKSAAEMVDIHAHTMGMVFAIFSAIGTISESNQVIVSLQRIREKYLQMIDVYYEQSVMSHLLDDEDNIGNSMKAVKGQFNG